MDIDGTNTVLYKVIQRSKPQVNKKIHAGGNTRWRIIVHTWSAFELLLVNHYNTEYYTYMHMDDYYSIILLFIMKVLL